MTWILMMILWSGEIKAVEVSHIDFCRLSATMAVQQGKVEEADCMPREKYENIKKYKNPDLPEFIPITKDKLVSDSTNKLQNYSYKQKPSTKQINIIENANANVLNPCLEEAFANHEISMCWEEDVSRWDERLNNAYSSLKKSLPYEEFLKLRKIQRNWIKYKNKKCDEKQWEDQGSSAASIILSCIRDVTALRTLELEALQ